MADFDHARSIAYRPGLCEWDPTTDSRAMTLRNRYVGCGNDATVAIGTVFKNNYHVCESCSKLKRFSRLKKRSLSRAAEIGPGILDQGEAGGRAVSTRTELLQIATLGGLPRADYDRIVAAAEKKAQSTVFSADELIEMAIGEFLRTGIVNRALEAIVSEMDVRLRVVIVDEEALSSTSSQPVTPRNR